MEFYASLIKVIVISVLLFTNIPFVLKLSFGPSVDDQVVSLSLTF